MQLRCNLAIDGSRAVRLLDHDGAIGPLEVLLIGLAKIERVAAGIVVLGITIPIALLRVSAAISVGEAKLRPYVRPAECWLSLVGLPVEAELASFIGPTQSRFAAAVPGLITKSVAFAIVVGCPRLGSPTSSAPRSSLSSSSSSVVPAATISVSSNSALALRGNGAARPCRCPLPASPRSAR